MIIFTSNATMPKSGDWNGIWFWGGVGILDYVMISYADRGVYVTDGYSYIGHSHLFNNNIGAFMWHGGHGDFYYSNIYNNTGNGIECYAGPNPGDFVSADLYKSIINSNGNVGLYCANTRVNITHSNFEFNYPS